MTGQLIGTFAVEDAFYLTSLGLVLAGQFTGLETGRRQPEASVLYERAGYRRTPNHAQYAGVEPSGCFRKPLGL